MKDRSYPGFSGPAKFGHILSFLALLLAPAVTLFGQSTSSIRGIVTDEQQGIIPNARVTLTASDTGASRTTTTSSGGDYQFLQIPPGSYVMTVNVAGFAERKIEQIQALVDTPATVNVTMAVAASAATVTVEAEAAQLNTVNASVGNTFQERQVQDLPLLTRNVVELLSLQPGVTTNGEVMGARRDQNNVTLDGVDANDNQNAVSGLNGTTANTGFNAALPVPLDSVMEFRVTVAGQGAEQGRSSGGQVSLVTRSGSNTIHGSAYEYNRNTALAANTWFNDRSGITTPQLVRNQFGASLGGPVKKDRVFYFMNYERRIDASQQAVNATVPTATLQQGNVLVGLKNGQVYTLTPAIIQQIDPLGIGVNQNALNIFKQYPAGNTPALGADNGLNFSGLQFNAPYSLDSRAYVAKFDWIVDSQAHHSVSFRGTLSNEGNTNIPAQFPGQQAASQLLSDNRGFSVHYTAVVTPSVINVVNLGLTRIGYGTTGYSGTALSFQDMSSPVNYVRANNRINPTWNVTDDITWNKGTHTIAGGANIRLYSNTLASFTNSYPSFSFSRQLAQGLGADMSADILNYIQTATGNSGLALSNSAADVVAMGDVLGLINNLSVTYQYQKNGSAIPLGTPQVTDFIAHSYEFYAQDTWKATRNFTLTYGLRYSYFAPPYEANGLQVDATPGLNQYFADRVGAAENGIPGNALPDSLLSYTLNGPVNGTSSWFKPDKNDWAPRISFAYTPGDGGILHWLGKNTVLRGGAAIAYDQYGNDLAASFSQLGSIGLATTLSAPQSYNFTNSPRYNGSLPPLPAVPQGGFPYTPPTVTSITTTYYGISPDLKAPYSYLLNFTAEHQFGHGFLLDVGYVGRLSHRLLIQQDVFAPAVNFKDPKSGLTWTQADGQLRALYDSGITPAMVKANPGIIPLNPFVEDMFAKVANNYIPGSATANYFYGIYQIEGGSDLDNLNDMDRAPYNGNLNSCFTSTGCYTFFSKQGSADPAWTNAGRGVYHGMVITLRRALQNGLSFDFNYTWSHSIDNGSTGGDTAAFTAGGTEFGGVMQNSFVPNQFRGSSDFDIRHQVNANFLYELPFGKGKRFFGSAPRWADMILGGWQVSALMRFASGLPTNIIGLGIYETNYYQRSLVFAKGPLPPTRVGTDSNGLPNLFGANAPQAIANLEDEYPGQTGQRAIVRVPGVRDVDTSVQKTFKITERFGLTFRAEAFNVFNFVNFNFTNSTGGSTLQTNLETALSGNFGEFSNELPPRVLQMALRLTF